MTTFVPQNHSFLSSFFFLSFLLSFFHPSTSSKHMAVARRGQTLEKLKLRDAKYDEMKRSKRGAGIQDDTTGRKNRGGNNTRLRLCEITRSEASTAV